ncbi:MAG: hypothetical protein VXU48_04405 [Verrucomicrobiota bacterium]|nr:hypothetical protein [Verrucomicrobiota bacterium]
MITWIQHLLLRHGRWVFLSLLAILIVAFVFTIGSTPGCTTDRSGYEENLFYGIDLNAPRDIELLVEKVQMSAYLNGQTIRSDEQFQSQIYNRIALLNLANEIGIPSPSQDVLAEFIQTKSAFQDETGAFSPEAYTTFVDTIESNPRSTKGLLILVLEEEYRIAQISSALSGPGYVLPFEARAQIQSRRTKLSLNTANFSYSKFKPEIPENTEVLREYYELNKLRYEIPERIQASYILFKSEDYADQVPKATEKELSEYFEANRVKFEEQYEFENPAPSTSEESTDEESPPLNETITLSKVRDSVTSSYLLEQKARAANQAAQSFAYSLYQDEIKRDSDAFESLLTETGASLTNIDPYSLASLSDASQHSLSTELLKSAFELGGNRYYSDAYEVNEGYAVLIYEGRITPEIPTFETILVEVTADYKADEKRRLFNEKGQAIQADLETKLSEGIGFLEAAEALSLVGKLHESFNIQNPPSEINPSALQRAQTMQPGEVSQMITSGGTGIFVHLIEQLVPDITPDDEELTQAEDYLSRFGAYTSGSSYANELVLKGLPKDAIDEN